MAPKKSSDKNTITFEHERETKGTNRYAEVTEGDAEPFIGTLYLRKTHPLSGEATLTVTLFA